MKANLNYTSIVCTFLFTLMMLIVVPAQGWATTSPPGWENVQKAKDYRDAGELIAAVIELKNALQKNPENLEARVLLGRVYLQMNKGAEAEKELRRARELGLERAAVITLLGQAFLIQGKLSELFEQVTVSDGFSDKVKAEVYALRGEAFLVEGDLDEAASAVQKSLHLRPQLARALLVQARMAMINGDVKTARQNIQTVLSGDPANVTGLSLLGDLEQSQGDLVKAEAAYGKVMQHSFDYSLAQLKRAMVRIELDDYVGAESDINALKKAVPDHAGVSYAEGLLSFRQRDAAKASAAFEKVLNQQPRNLSAVFYLGVSHYIQGNVQQAEHHLDRYVSARPGAVRASTLLGMTRLQIGDLAGAEKVLRPVSLSRPDDSLVLKTLGKILVAQGKVEEGNKYLAKAVTLQPDSAGDRVDLAIGLLRSGQEEAGIKELETAISLDPAMRQADILLIREYLQTGEFDKALTASEHLLAKWPESPAPLILKGMAYAGKGDIDKTRAAFEQVLKLQPGEPSAAANMAALELSAGQFDSARDYYQQVLKYHPGHLQTLLKLAQMESQAGNEEEARARLDEAVRANPDALQPRILIARVHLAAGNPLKALVSLREVQEKHEGNPAYLEVLGEAQAASGESASAVRIFKKLVELTPRSARAHYLLAHAYGMNKDDAGLRDALFKGLDHEPNHPLAAGVIELYVKSAPSLEETEKRIDELKLAQPEHPQVANLEGQLALNQNMPGKAIEIFSGLRERFPHESLWVLKLAHAQWQSGEYQVHLEILSEWLKQQPQDVTAQFMQANSYLQLERNAEAKAAFSKVIELSPNNAVALNNLAWLLRKDDPQQAMVYAEKAQQLNPNDAGIMDTLGVVLIERGEAARAVEVLQEAAKVRPDMLAIKYHLATALAKQGDKENARKELKRILRQERDFPEREEAQALLLELGH